MTLPAAQAAAAPPRRRPKTVKAPCPICGASVRMIDPGPQASAFLARHKGRQGRSAGTWCEGSYVGVARPGAGKAEVRP